MTVTTIPLHNRLAEVITEHPVAVNDLSLLQLYAVGWIYARTHPNRYTTSVAASLAAGTFRNSVVTWYVKHMLGQAATSHKVEFHVPDIFEARCTNCPTHTRGVGHTAAEALVRSSVSEWIGPAHAMIEATYLDGKQYLVLSATTGGDQRRILARRLLNK